MSEKEQKRVKKGTKVSIDVSWYAKSVVELDIETLTYLGGIIDHLENCQEKDCTALKNYSEWESAEKAFKYRKDLLQILRSRDLFEKLHTEIGRVLDEKGDDLHKEYLKIIQDDLYVVNGMFRVRSYIELMLTMTFAESVIENQKRKLGVNVLNVTGLARSRH